MREGILAQELALLIAVVGAVLRIDDSDFGDAHRSVILQLAFETLEAIFRRQHLKNGQWRVGNDLLDGAVAVKHRHIEGVWERPGPAIRV